MSASEPQHAVREGGFGCAWERESERADNCHRRPSAAWVLARQLSAAQPIASA